MTVISITLGLAIAGIILIILGQILSNKKIKIAGIVSILLIIVLWIGIIIWGDIEEKGKRDVAFSNNDTTNNISEENNIEVESENTNEIVDITEKFLNEYLYLNGKITKVEDNKIYIIDKDNKEYVLENNEQINYIDGRTNKKYLFTDITENYYINVSSSNKTCYLFKDIKGEELKKELLISLSLPDTARMQRTGIEEILEIKQLGNNQAIVTFRISDIVSSEYFSGVNDEELKFNVKFKATNNTKYKSKGNYTYNADTIENSKKTIVNLKLDENTLDYKYPEIREFISSDT